MWAIYLKHNLKSKSEQCESVLLIDGAWTAERNCFKQEYGFTLMKPRLFPRKRNAVAYAKRLGKSAHPYTVHKYEGPVPQQNPQ